MRIAPYKPLDNDSPPIAVDYIYMADSQNALWTVLDNIMTVQHLHFSSVSKVTNISADFGRELGI
jgi:hypothetical protein